MADNNQNDNSKLFIPTVLAILFVLLTAAGVWAGQIKPSIPQHESEPDVVVIIEEESAAEEEAEVDMAAVNAAIIKGGCIACHTISDIPDAIGQVGPDLSHIGTDGATRIEGYNAKDYIRESLQDPLAFTAPDCPFGPCMAGTMPPLMLDDTEIEAIVSFLVTLQ